MKVKLLILIVVAALSVIIWFFVGGQRDAVISALPSSLSVSESPAATPTQLPFIEMTIPYLRSRNYESKLGERKRLSENPTYMSYATSYDSDGLKINGLLTVPKGDVPPGGFPAVVFVHGYVPPTLYRTTGNYVEYVDSLARNGFVVFKIDLRGHDDSEGEPGGAYYSSDYVIDTLNARAALASFDQVNKNRIGLWGHSMVGNVTMRAFTARPEIPAVVIWAGAGYTYTDLTSYRISDNSYRPPEVNTNRQRKREQLREAHGDFNAEHPFWKQVAVTDYLKDLKGALSVHHAVDDAVVSVEYSRNLMKLMDLTTVKHALYEYPGGGHNITGSYFTIAMQRTVDFYKEQL